MTRYEKFILLQFKKKKFGCKKSMHCEIDVKSTGYQPTSKVSIVIGVLQETE